MKIYQMSIRPVLRLEKKNIYDKTRKIKNLSKKQNDLFKYIGQKRDKEIIS